MSRRSPIEWVNYYCPQNHWDIPYLHDIADRLTNSLKALVFVPRGHGKTLLAIGLICKYIVETEKPVCIITSARSQQKRIFRAIISILNSPKIIKDYKFVLGSYDKTMCELLPDDTDNYPYLDPLLRVATRGSDIVGSHPTWIHIEDLIQEPFKSDESNEALIEWWGGIVEFCLTYEEGEETRITGTGTRKDKGDFWEHLIDEYHYPHYSRKAIELVKGQYPIKEDITFDDQGNGSIDITKGEYKTLNCPNWPLGKLLIERIYKPERFMAEMQNDPMPKGGLYFSLDDWIEVAEPPPHHHTSYYMAVDPAFGKGTAADNTAIIVCGVFDDKLYVIDGTYGRVMDGLDSDRMLSEIVRLAQYYQPKGIWIESNNFQFLISKQLSFQGQLPLPVTELTNLTKKIERISSMKTYFRSGDILICPSPFLDGLKTEYTSYNQKPSTKSRKDDALDALEMVLTNVVYFFGKHTERIKAGWL